MELNWSTFVLEIINFLVLIWILKRFLYQPILGVIEKRRSAIEARLSESNRLRDEAQSLKSQYEGRLADWEQERRQARDALSQETEAERKRQLAALRDTLEHEREKARVAHERQHTEQQRAAEYRAMLQGAAFAGRLLQQASGPELEERLLRLLLQELAQLSTAQLDGLRRQWGTAPDSIEVSSAFVLADEQRASLETALQQINGQPIPVRYSQDSELLAGLRIVIGAWVLAANLRDELSGFAEFAHVPR